MVQHQLLAPQSLLSTSLSSSEKDGRVLSRGLYNRNLSWLLFYCCEETLTMTKTTYKKKHLMGACFRFRGLACDHHGVWRTVASRQARPWSSSSDLMSYLQVGGRLGQRLGLLWTFEASDLTPCDLLQGHIYNFPKQFHQPGNQALKYKSLQSLFSL